VLDAGDIGDIFNERRKISDLGGAAHLAAVGVHVLPEQRDLAHALVGQLRHFNQHIVERAVDFFAAGVGHDAVAAILRTAFHDRDKSAHAFTARRRQMVKLFNLGKADVHLRLLCLRLLGQQFRQAVQRLRAKDDVDIGRTRHNRRAFL
jgi:hypothetical protein